MRAHYLSGMAALFMAMPWTAIAAPGDTQLITGWPPGARPGYGESLSLSADGRYVAYVTSSDNIVVGDTNGREDVFVYDRQTGATERVSVSTSGGESNGDNYEPAISADGRYVTFTSYANNLAAGATGNNIFLHDRTTGTTEIVSVDSNEVPGQYDSYRSSISADGRYVVFDSRAANLVAGDTNDSNDVFLRDRSAGTTVRISVDNSGQQVNGHSTLGKSSLSADGRYVAFASAASNLVAGDSNETFDVFVRDLQTGHAERVSVSSTGTQADDYSVAPTISSDGRYVAFTSLAANLVPNDTNQAVDTFVHDRVTGSTERASVNSAGGQGTVNSDIHNSSAEFPALSGDGRYVTFYSGQGNLVSGDNDGLYQMFVRDRVTGTTATLGAVGYESIFREDYGSSLSTDGRYIAFRVQGRIYLADQQTGTITLISVTTSQTATGHIAADRSVSADGRYIAFTSSAQFTPYPNGVPVNRVWVTDTQTGVKEQIGESGRDPAISPDGRYVAFVSSASTLVPEGSANAFDDIFLRDRASGATERISVNDAEVEGNAVSLSPSVSADGRFVAFASRATNLVAADTNNSLDVFLRDRVTGTTRRISVSSSGEAGNSESTNPTVSADGRYVAFDSIATNLVPGDSNGLRDVFLYDTSTNVIRRVSVTSTGAQATKASLDPSISADGRYVAFQSAGLLNGSDANNIFVRDMNGTALELISVGPSGGAASAASLSSISADGRYVSFSANEDLLPGGNARLAAVFVRDRVALSTFRASIATDGSLANDASNQSSISADGRHVAFNSLASNLTERDFDSAEDVFVHEFTASAAEALRINAGGASFTDSQGHVWAADTGFNTGSVSTSTAPIAGTADDSLYQSIRWDDTPAPELQYSVPVANGSYLVKLYFAESNTKTAYAGARVFDVDMEGSVRFDNLDVFAQAGGLNTALVKSATVTVSDGVLNILLRHQVKNPIISAIEIVPQESAPVGVVIRTNAGGGVYTDSSGQAWAADSGFNTGSTSTSSAPIAGTADDSLYQSIRWDDTPAPELQYSYTVPNGSYTVNLHFAESNTKTAYAGARVFDIDIEGVQRFDNVDVYAQAGGLNTALTKSTVVNVTDGQINILLRHQVKNPIVSASEIIGR
ncbi:MAG: malectin domain-containing carbohydrate-binding protein [Steroidobacteraceae bacterium]